MDIDLLDRKIRRLVSKLKGYAVHIERFEEDDITYGDMLGKGGEGVVQNCTVMYKGISIPAAVKTLLKTDDDSTNMAFDEIEMLCLAYDPVINTTLRVYGVCAVTHGQESGFAQLAIVTEAGVMDALRFYQRNIVPLHVTLELCSSVAKAVHIMHENHIMHQDIKPENILIKHVIRDENGNITELLMRVIDLGMAQRVFTHTGRIQTDDILGTHGYHPPEMLHEDGHDFRADTFTLGISFSVLLTKRQFIKHSLPGLLKQLHYAKTQGVSGKELFEMTLEPHIKANVELPPPIKHMLCNMLECERKRTISLIDVVNITHQEAEKAKLLTEQLPPTLSPCTTEPRDSGIHSTSTSYLQQSHKGRRRSLSISSSRSNYSIATRLSSQKLHDGPVLRSRKDRTSYLMDGL